jgi:hypothetical protein
MIVINTILHQAEFLLQESVETTVFMHDRLKKQVFYPSLERAQLLYSVKAALSHHPSIKMHVLKYE